MGYGNSINPLWMNSAMLGAGIDYSSIASDPYFMQMLRAQNINFKGGASDFDYLSAAAASGAGNTQSVQAGQTAVDGGIPVTLNTEESSDSGIGTTLAAGGALAALITTGVLIKKGKLGKAGEAIRKFFSSSEEKLATKPMKTFRLDIPNNAQILVKDGQVKSVSAMEVISQKTEESGIVSFLGKKPEFYDPTTGKLADNTRLLEYTIKENRLVMTSPTTSRTYSYNFVVNEEGVITKIIKDGRIEAEGEEAIANFMTNPENKEVLQNVANKVKAIEEGGFDKYKELKDVSFEQIIPDKNAIYTRTPDGKQELVIKKLKTNMTPEEQKVWLHKHKDEYETAVKQLLENGRGEGITRQQFLYTDPEGNEILVNELGEIQKIITFKRKPWDIFGWAKKEPVEIKKDTTEYHSWLQDHKSVEDEVNKIVKDGIATDSTQTIFRIDG